MGSFFRGDEEMGKKDDDHPLHKQSRLRSSTSSWKAARTHPRKTLRRLGILLLVTTLVYFFVKNIPTDLQRRDRRRPVYTYPDSRTPPGNPRPPPNHASDAGDSTAPATREYSGVVRFLELAASLHAIAATQGTEPLNKNVLFAASSLDTAARLLPLACQMGIERRSYVHFVLMGRSDVDIQRLQQINGIDDSCHIIFHDARPDFAPISDIDRLERSVARGLYHINTYMHPQAVIISLELEETFFLKAIRDAAAGLDLAKNLIELPANAEDRLAWMTKLDSSSLSAWNKMSFDILIHAHAGSSGGLIRLLESLSAADFTSCAVPHLTIELPEKIDPPTAIFLKTFQWPPRGTPNPTNSQQITLRHRIVRRGANEEESSVQFLESFYPADPVYSHALVLSPNVELSREFFHYLKYTMLEYRYSSNALYQAYDQRLFSISLDLPSTFLNASGIFEPPSSLVVPDTLDTSSPFLWSAPNSNAVLIAGEKWVELHGFVSHLLEFQQGLKTLPDMLAEKVVSKKFPAWMELALRLCRARGYWTLYPSPKTAANLAVVHDDLYRPPEEYEKDAKPQSHKDDSAEVALRRGTLLDSLPGKGSPMPFVNMPLLAWDGEPTTLSDLNEAAITYTMDLKRTIGGCAGLGARPDPYARDLFCINDEDV